MRGRRRGAPDRADDQHFQDVCTTFKTGGCSIVRCLRLSEVQGLALTQTLKRDIVATEEERDQLARTWTTFSVESFRARLWLLKHLHPLYQHERIIVCGKIHVDSLQPCANTREPMEVEHNLDFKTAFREDGAFLEKSGEEKWGNFFKEAGMRPDLEYEEELQKRIGTYRERPKSSEDIEENLFAECLIDGILNVGSLCEKVWGANINHYKTKRRMDGRILRRLEKRMKRTMGIDAQFGNLDEQQDAEENNRALAGFR